MGISMSVSTVGTTNGINPNMAYFAIISAMRPSMGIAGYGRPLKSM